MNVLVIMCDELRYDALGCNGNKAVATPNIDRLAQRSVCFDSCYTQAPVCSPARHSLATGKYPFAHGVLDNNYYPNPGMYTIAHALKPLGYRRFHLGHMHWKTDKIDNGYEPIVCHSLNELVLSPQVLKRHHWEHDNMTRRCTAGPSTLKRDEYWGYQVADRSVHLMEEAVQRGEKFLSWTSFTEPHPPFYPPKELYAKFDQSKLELPVELAEGAPEPHPSIREKQKEWEHLTDVEKRQMKAGYYGMVELADHYVGMVLEAVDRLKLWDNTMIILTADHGEQMGDHGLYTKFVLREPSVHVPLMIYHPEVKPGRRSELVEHVDILPTICDFTGAALPEGIHGHSLTPLMQEDSAPQNWRDSVFSQIRGHRMLRTKQWKLNEYDGTPGELYNLVNDPNELFNLIDDTNYQSVKEELIYRLNKISSAEI